MGISGNGSEGTRELLLQSLGMLEAAEAVVKNLDTHGRGDPLFIQGNRTWEELRVLIEVIKARLAETEESSIVRV